MSDLLEEALKELERAKEARAQPVESLLARRQAAEKAWGFVVEQTSRVAGITVTGPEAHKERKTILGELDRAAGTALLRDYEDLERRLHGDCFYESRCPLPDVESGIHTAREFPRKLEEALRRVRG